MYLCFGFFIENPTHWRSQQIFLLRLAYAIFNKHHNIVLLSVGYWHSAHIILFSKSQLWPHRLCFFRKLRSVTVSVPEKLHIFSHKYEIKTWICSEVFFFKLFSTLQVSLTNTFLSVLGQRRLYKWKVKGQKVFITIKRLLAI